MIQEIYIRPIGDPKYNEDKLDVSDEYEMLYSKILMILSTKKGEVLGDPNFGLSLEEQLFTFDIDEGKLREQVFNQISLYAPESGKFKLKLEIKRFRGSVRDIILLDFIVDGRKSFGVMVK